MAPGSVPEAFTDFNLHDGKTKMTTPLHENALVDAAWLKDRLQDPRLHVIEVSGMADGTHEHYLDGHIPGAVFWDWKEQLWDDVRRDFPAAEVLAQRFARAGVGPSDAVVFYSRDTQFGVYGWWVSTYCGFKNVYVLDGGERAWQALGESLETGAVRPAGVPEGPASSGRRESMRVRREDVLDALGQSDVALVDARTPQEYSGETVSPRGAGGAIRSGRIPGAISIPYFTLLDEHKRFLPKKALAETFAAQGVDKAREVIVYCRLGHRASFMYFILTQLLGWERVRSYDGSWIEWGNMVGVPIEK